jgi:uncharacterized repeat protein (TIGR03806 family)
LDGPFPYDRLSDYGLFTGELAALSPAPGVHLYEVASPLWSDGATKLRHIVLPQGTSLTPAETDAWEMPLGGILVKTFAYPRQDVEPDGPLLLVETRLLIREQEGWTNHVYIWNAEQTDAVRHISGKITQVPRTAENGEAYSQTYVIPNTNQCKECHALDHETTPIGLSTLQLNRRILRDGEEVEQLTWLRERGALGEGGAPPEALPRLAAPDSLESLDSRARSYLHANCGHCHRPGGGGGPSGLVLLATETDPYRIGVCKKPVAAGAGSGELFYGIVPGEPDASILVHRMSSTDPAIKMPEIPNLLVDEAGVALIREWILQMTPKGCAP